MRTTLKMLSLSILMLSLLLTAVPALPARAAESLVVTSYEANSSSITKGQTVSLTLHLKYTGSADSVKNIDVSRLVDSFSGGTKAVSTRTTGSAPLEFDVTYSGLVYSGTGRSFRLMVGLDGSYDNVEISVSQAVEYDASKVDTTPPAVPQPTVQVTSSALSAPITAGQDFTVTVSFRNISTTSIKNAMVSFTASDSLILQDAVSSYSVGDIEAGRTGTAVVRLKAGDTISSASQSLTADLKFNYPSAGTLSQGTISERINIPAKVRGKDAVSQPTVIVTRSAVHGTVKAGQELPIKITFANVSKTALLNPVATFTPSEAVTLLGDYSTYVLKDIPAGESKSVTIRVRANKELTATSQSVSTELKFSYDTGDALANASVSDRVSFATTPSSATDTPTPNIIVSKFDYGQGTISAGTKFPLTIRFRNTSDKLPMENIVAALETGENFSMDGATNTYYYKKLAAGAEKKLSVPMQALSTAKTGAQTTTVTFKYEYVDGTKRASGTASIILSIPVIQPDRFSVLNPTVPASVNAGEETTLSLSYVNKGKAEVSNVEAKIEAPADAITTPSAVQNLGNFESGKSGVIGFAFTPNTPGELDLTLVISYENANAEVQTKQFPIHLTVQEAMQAAEDMPAEEVPADTRPVKLYLIIGGSAAAAVIVIVIFLFVRRKKKAAAKAQAVSSWDNWDSEESTDGTPAKDAEAEPSGKE